MKKSEWKTTTQTTTTRSDNEHETALAYLSTDEEKVVRMLHGLGEADDAVLEFALGASEDSRLRLALMEALNLAELQGRAPTLRGADREVIEKLVQRYQDYD
ncbi:MAG: hypothetical protein RBU37_02630 [Myxococcota bacterium]|nr:hypothetical protein [Myxococcota bacterium]